MGLDFLVVGSMLVLVWGGKVCSNERGYVVRELLADSA